MTPHAVPANPTPVPFGEWTVLDRLTGHIERFGEHPHPAFGGQPVCPFARRARKDDRVATVVTRYALANDSAVHAALDWFDPQDKDVLLIVHPEADGLSYSDLFDLRGRLAVELAGRYEVFTGHPDDPFARAGVLTRQEPFPVLHLVRTDRLIEAEQRLSPRRRSTDAWSDA